MIRFKTTLYTIDGRAILRLTDSASAQLSSRGMLMADAVINGTTFTAPLEPDGAGGHWLQADGTTLKAAKISPGDTVTVELEPIKTWPRPEVPTDLQKALVQVPEARKIWEDITPNAQWEWIRWIRSSKYAETRERHVTVACSKMKAGMRRPCCFNRNMCTVPEVAKNGVLLEPAHANAS